MTNIDCDFAWFFECECVCTWNCMNSITCDISVWHECVCGVKCAYVYKCKLFINEERGRKELLRFKDGVFENEGRGRRDPVGVKDGVEEGAGGIQ